MEAARACVVIGAGVSGLCAAHHLRRALGPGAVTVLEAGTAPGGTARTHHEHGFTMEWGPNGFLDREPRTLDWVRDLGLDHRLIRANAAAARRFLYRGGRLHELLPPPRFLLHPPLSVLGRLRLLCEPLVPGKRDDSPETIHDFARRRIGREAADFLVGPMVAGIFGGDAKTLSLEHCFPRMAAMEREHGGLFRALRARRRESPGASPMGPGGTLTCFDGGIATLVDTAAAALGDDLRLGVAATAIHARAGAFDIETGVGETLRADRVIVATPAHVAAALVGPLSQHAAGALANIPYAGIAVVCTAHRREDLAHDLNGFGFLAPRGQGLRLLGCIWTSSLFPGQAPEGHVLLRTMIGGSTDPEAARLPHDELVALTQRELAPILGIRQPPVFAKVFAWERGIPQYTLGHGLRIKAIDTLEQEHPGLAFAGNAYRGVGLNDCVVSAHRALERLGVSV
jgi:oxygen-dependent protoporphyrinogen oxidase